MPLDQRYCESTLPLAGEAVEYPMSCQSIADSLRSPDQFKLRVEWSTERRFPRQAISAFSSHTRKCRPDWASTTRQKLGKRVKGKQNVTKAGPRYRSSVSSPVHTESLVSETSTNRGLTKHLRPKLTIQVPTSRPAGPTWASHNIFAESRHMPSFVKTSPRSSDQRTKSGPKPKLEDVLNKGLPAFPTPTSPFKPAVCRPTLISENHEKLERSSLRMSSSTSSNEMGLPVSRSQLSAMDSAALAAKGHKLSKAARILGVSQDILIKEEATMMTFLEDTSDSESDGDLTGSRESKASSLTSLDRSSRSSLQSSFRQGEIVCCNQPEPYYPNYHESDSPENLGQSKSDLQPSSRSKVDHQSHSRHSRIPRSAPKLTQPSINNRIHIDSRAFSLDNVPRTPPAIPKKSDKRALSQTKKRSDAVMKAVERALAEVQPLRAVDILHPAERVSARPLSLAVRKKSESLISAADAEHIILRILAYCHELRDLGVAAQINQGFLTVFRRHQLDLVKKALFNNSPAAFELREILSTDTIENSYQLSEEVKASEYLKGYFHDKSVVQSLKSIIRSQCRSYLKPETLAALEDPKSSRTKQIDNAFWRIWTFCAIFGSGRGREDDIVGQMDWLDGGFLAHQSNGFCATGSEEAFQSSKVLLNAPDTFGCSNKGGLTAEELYDMTEIWNCLKAILNGILGDDRVGQARNYGIFLGQNGNNSDATNNEGDMLEEWVHYVASLGLSVVLSLALQATSKDDEVFEVAHEKGWTAWDRPDNEESKSTFLKEAVTRVYQDRIVASMVASGMKGDELAEIRMHKKQRSAELAAELRQLKLQGDSHWITPSQERPMSIWTNEDARSSIMPEATFSSMPTFAQQRRSRAKSFGESDYWVSARSRESTISPLKFDTTSSETTTNTIQDSPIMRPVQMVSRLSSSSFNMDLHCLTKKRA